MRTRIKICGLTTLDTLGVALEGGADFVGAVVFPKSPRHLDPEAATALFERARGRAKIVAVTVDPDDGLLDEIARVLRPDFIQLHGSETPARAERVRALTGAGVIKALPIRQANDFAAAERWIAGIGRPRCSRWATVHWPGNSGLAARCSSSQPGATTAEKGRPSNWGKGSTTTAATTPVCG